MLGLVTEEAGKLQHKLTGRNIDVLITRRRRPIADERTSFEFLLDRSFGTAAPL
jgi:hypothetical protein